MPNRLTADLKELIQRRGRPVEFLADVARGVKIRVGPQAGPAPSYVYPSMSDRMWAAGKLLDKLLADQRAIGGPEGEALFPATIPIEPTTRQLAMSVLELVRQGTVEAEGSAPHPPFDSVARALRETVGSGTILDGPAATARPVEPGTVIPVVNANGASLVFDPSPNGEEFWLLVSGAGERMERHRSRERLQQRATELALKRRI